MANIASTEFIPEHAWLLHKVLSYTHVFRGGYMNAFLARVASSQYSKVKMWGDLRFKCIAIHYALNSKGGGTTRLGIYIEKRAFPRIIRQMKEADPEGFGELLRSELALHDENERKQAIREQQQAERELDRRERATKREVERLFRVFQKTSKGASLHDALTECRDYLKNEWGKTPFNSEAEARNEYFQELVEKAFKK